MNLGARLLTAADRTPNALALVSDSGSVTYGHLATSAARLAARLAQSIEPGARVAIVARNEAQFIVGYLATLLAGGIAVPFEPDAPVAELTRYARRVLPAITIASPGCASVAEETAREVDSELIVLDDDTDRAIHELDPLPVVDRSGSDVAALLFTSGTAGSPKAAMLTHGSLAANLDQVKAHGGLALSARDVGLGVAPFFHVLGLNPVLGAALDAGGSIILSEHFDPRATLPAPGVRCPPGSGRRGERRTETDPRSPTGIRPCAR